LNSVWTYENSNFIK